MPSGRRSPFVEAIAATQPLDSLRDAHIRLWRNIALYTVFFVPALVWAAGLFSVPVLARIVTGIAYLVAVAGEVWWYRIRHVPARSKRRAD
jgi:hypothetical protein